jgi:hypothetical protein
MAEQSTAQALSPPSKHPNLGGWLLWSFTILVLYVLSVGPAFRLELAGLISPAVNEIIYAPIQYACLRCRAAARVYVWYLHIWGIRAIDQHPYGPFAFAGGPKR